MHTHLPSQYQEFIHLSRYARWRDKDNRRETWDETVARYCDFFERRAPDLFPRGLVEKAILALDVMPSMRALMTAGPALEKDNIAGFNCSYIRIDDVRAFDEVLYILMCGTGVGFSCESRAVAELPPVPEHLYPTETTIIVRDSKLGWATAFRELLSLLWAGKVPQWDLSKIRPAGARLKVFGGRASGPDPLNDLFHFSVDLFKASAGRKLTSLQCHDLVCKIADVVVVGGVRRSALISLSDLEDDKLRNAKQGPWWEKNPQRALANNSAVYEEKPDMPTFLAEWEALIASQSGERGIFSRYAANRKVDENGGRQGGFEWGVNPCGEIILRPAGLCNLSEVVIRPNDTLETLKSKVEAATIIGTFQSTLTNFRYVRSIWRHNAEDERLLGVSLTGILDNPVLSQASRESQAWLMQLKQHAIEVNTQWAAKLGINRSAAVTTVKPSGTVSQLVNAASGIHPRYAPFYIRTVRADKKDPLASFMRVKGFPAEDCVMKPETTDIFSFPINASASMVFRDDRTAIEQLEHYMLFRDYWCEHNPSVTVYVRDHEWAEVGDWVYHHFDRIGGVSFLPHTNHSYRQAPYTECTAEEHATLVGQIPTVDWSELGDWEREDFTAISKELACTAGQCEL